MVRSFSFVNDECFDVVSFRIQCCCFCCLFYLRLKWFSLFFILFIYLFHAFHFFLYWLCGFLFYCCYISCYYCCFSCCFYNLITKIFFHSFVRSFIYFLFVEHFFFLFLFLFDHCIMTTIDCPCNLQIRAKNNTIPKKVLIISSRLIKDQKSKDFIRLKITKKNGKITKTKKHVFSLVFGHNQGLK